MSEARSNGTESATRKKTPRGVRRKAMSKTDLFLLTLVFFVVIGYVFAGLVSMAKKPNVRTVSVERGAADLPSVFHGVIIREEKVYESPSDGVARFDYAELSKVKKGARVCVIQDDETVERFSAEINAIKERMLETQEMRGEISGFSQDVKRVNRQIQEIVDSGRARLLRDVSSVRELKDNVERAINMRNNMLFGDNRGSMAEMAEEKSLLEKQLEKNIAVIYAAEGGVLSYAVDGLESSLTPDSAKNLTAAQTKMTVDSQLRRERETEAGASVFKIVTSNEWRIAFYAPEKDVADWKAGDERSVYAVKSGVFETLDVTVEVNEKRPSEIENYVLLKCSSGMADYLDSRSINLKLLSGGKEGFKIPMACVVDRTLIAIPKQYISEDGKVTIRRADSVEIVKISPVEFAGDELNAYIIADPCASPRIGDTLTREPQADIKLTRVENIKGVFVERNGYADFVKIDFNGSTSADYVALDEKANGVINLNDKIILDAKSLKDGQKIN
ncbi:MAG: hypothetical protein LBL35_04000 [Clostridiales bacterium]|jgi:hypothetical protein|nr:hypothetical protein [Clostridiales bacterium]